MKDNRFTYGGNSHYLKQEILILQYYLEHLELRTCTTVLVRRSLPREREREKK